MHRASRRHAGRMSVISLASPPDPSAPTDARREDATRSSQVALNPARGTPAGTLANARHTNTHRIDLFSLFLFDRRRRMDKDADLPAISVV